VASSEAVLRLFLLDASPAALSRLRARLPRVICTPIGLEIPLDDCAPEEILALCLQLGVSARATRIMERPRPG
jgi:hypothetical protein